MIRPGLGHVNSFHLHFRDNKMLVKYWPKCRSMATVGSGKPGSAGLAGPAPVTSHRASVTQGYRIKMGTHQRCCMLGGCRGRFEMRATIGDPAQPWAGGSSVPPVTDVHVAPSGGSAVWGYRAPQLQGNDDRVANASGHLLPVVPRAQGRQPQTSDKRQGEIAPKARLRARCTQNSSTEHKMR
jgi:hypothetical protein